MSQISKNIFAVTLLGGVAILGYFMFVQKDSNTLLMEADNQVSNQLLVQASGFVKKRTEIESLVIDTSILLDSRFANLTTYTNTVVNQNIGKTSLFEPSEEIGIN